MSGLLAAEWLKLRKRWMPRIILVILLGILCLVFWGFGTERTRNNLFIPRGLLVAVLYAAPISSFLWPVLAGSWAGNEYGWGTVRTVLSRRPGRIQFTLAGLAIILASVALALLAALVVGGVAGSIVALVTGNDIVWTANLPSSFPLILVKCLLASWYAVSFYAVLAFAAGSILRSAAGGIGVGIGFTVAELIVGGIFDHLGGIWQHIAEHFPSQYTSSLPERIAREALPPDFGGSNNGTASVSESIMWLAIYIAVLLALMLVFVRIRDVTD